MLKRKFFPDIPYSAPLMRADGTALMRIWPSLPSISINGRPLFLMRVDPVTGNPTPYGPFSAYVTQHLHGAVSIQYLDRQNIAHNLCFDSVGDTMSVTIQRGGVETETGTPMSPASVELIHILREQMGLHPR